VELTDEGLADPVIGHFRRKERVFQSHGDIFDVPQSAVHLARSEICHGQAFRYGKNAYGLQFHLEVNDAIIEDWFAMPENQPFFSGPAAKFSPEAIRQDTQRFLERSTALSEETFQRFLRVAGSKERAIRLGSGHGKCRE
jgi:GMP synthase-like glutamine amidotransferase